MDSNKELLPISQGIKTRVKSEHSLTKRHRINDLIKDSWPQLVRPSQTKGKLRGFSRIVRHHQALEPRNGPPLGLVTICCERQTLH